MKKPPSRRRAGLTEEKVLAAAVALADVDGLGRLSMRRLGQSLRVEAMSLYKHVANKDELLSGMVERVAAEFRPPRPDAQWREALEERARAAHEVLMRHPWATQLIISRANTGPAMLRYVDATIGCLVGAGFTYAQADHAWNAMDNHIYGFTLQKLNFPFEPSEYAAAAEGYIDQIPRDVFPHLHGMAREVIDGRHDGVNDFEFGLTLILDGLERLRSPA